MDTPTDTPGKSPKPSIRKRLEAMFAEWGVLLLIVWLSIFGLTWVGFAFAIQLGFGDWVERHGGSLATLGTWGAAYFAAELTKPLRIAATAVITPAIGTLLRRLRRSKAEASSSPAAPAELPPNGTLDETPSGQP